MVLTKWVTAEKVRDVIGNNPTIFEFDTEEIEEKLTEAMIRECWKCSKKVMSVWRFKLYFLLFSFSKRRFKLYFLLFSFSKRRGATR